MAINAAEFNLALAQIEEAKGISKETVIEALKEAMIKGYRKQLGGDDADVRVNIDPDNGILEMFNVKKVVSDVQDDFLEVSVEEAQEVDPSLKEGDDFFIPASIEDLRKATAMSIKSILKQKFAEAEKEILYKAFQDKIGTIITGKVEKTDERGCSVNIGRTSVYLSRKEMVGDERFNSGDPIKLYVGKVENGTKGTQIQVSRASEGFLSCLLTEEIHEIYDGTIIVKSIARQAGERSKVAVYSNDPNVDPAGACIGQNGIRIQKVVGQLGNGTEKEKIDIIAWSENPALFVMESLKPARVVGIDFDEETRTSTVIVKDDSLSLAIGRKGVNARLAVKLTGYKIDIKTESEALEEGFRFNSFEEIQAQEVEERNRKILEMQKAAYEKSNQTADVLPGLPEGYVAPQQRIYEEETSDLDESLREQVENEEVVSPVETKVEETVMPVEEKEEVKAPVQEVEVKTTEVKTTTTLEDLEKSLESENKKSNNQKSYRKKKKASEEETEEKITTVTDPSQRMSIYTDDELKELEEEEYEDDNYDDEEDIDYDEFDSYYDEK